jgi:hypothetical protein
LNRQPNSDIPVDLNHGVIARSALHCGYIGANWYNMPVLRMRHAIMVLTGFTMLPGLSMLAGCETYSAPNIREVSETTEPAGTRLVRIERCQDRTGKQRARNLAKEATKTLTEKLGASDLFDVADGAPFLVSCDIERFVEGSAAQRWLLPGWGQTLAQVKVGVWRLPDHSIVATFVSKAQVRAGGLYTIGADQYIVDVAMNDIVRQMEDWASRKEVRN